LAGAAGGGGAFVQFLTQSTREMSSQIKLSDALGLNHNVMRLGMEQTGMEAHEFATKISKLNIVIGQAAGGSTEARGKLVLAGLDPEKLVALKTTDERLRSVAHVFQTLK